MSGVLSYSNWPGIYIHDPAAKAETPSGFVEKARAALLKLDTGKRGFGKELLKQISEALLRKSQRITIEPAVGFDGQAGPGWAEGENLLRWTPLMHPSTSGNLDQLNDIPTFIILGHELVHAHHSLTGSTRYTDSFSDNKAIEEARTIGLGPWALAGLTENSLRDEWGLPRRTTFSGSPPERLLKGTRYAL